MNAIGIDVGGSKICAVRWNGARVEKLAVAKTPQSAAELTKVLHRIIGTLAHGRRLRVGVGFAGVVHGGEVVRSPNNRFLKNYDVKKALGRAVAVENDARCFARAEYTKGAGKGARRAIFFTFGTGIGRAYGVQGNIKHVKRFEYPETWEKRYQRVKGVAALAPFLAERVSPLIRLYKPRVIVAGGGVAEKKGFLAAFRAELRKRGLKSAVVGAKLGTLAGAIGAALIAK